MSGVRSMTAVAIRGGRAHAIARALPEETPVAIVIDGSTQAVMMATPGDLTDFAMGFALTEGFISTFDEISDFELVTHDAGIEARFWLTGPRSAALKDRRRAMLGPVGCGLCEIDSLGQALRAVPPVGSPGVRFTAAEVAGATDALGAQQPLHDQTHAAHAAGFMVPGCGIILVREDVGRHNALDKLIGAMARGGVEARRGAVVLTSRVSVEMVQKTAMAGCPVLIAVSGPTARALRVAEHAGITVAAFARAGGFDVYSHARRILQGACDVA